MRHDRAATTNPVLRADPNTIWHADGSLAGGRNRGGAKSPQKTDWSVVKGRRVIIATDHDKAGSQFGDAVYDLCKTAGADSVFYLPAEAIGNAKAVLVAKRIVSIAVGSEKFSCLPGHK